MKKTIVKYCIILIITLICPNIVFGQMSLREADSLENLLSRADDTSKIDLYNKLSMFYRHNHFNKGMEYAIYAINLSESINDYPRIIKSYNTLAINQRNANFLLEALGNFKNAFLIAQKFNVDSILGFCANNVARLYLENNQLDSAKKYIYIALKDSNKNKNLHNLSYAYLNYGILSKLNNNYIEAKKYFDKAYNIRHDSLKISRDFLHSLWYLMDIYASEKKYDKAKELIYIMLKEENLSNWHEFNSRLWQKLGEIYYQTQNYDSSEYALKQSILQSNLCFNSSRIESAYKLLDSVYLAQKDYKKAAEICKTFSEINDTIFNSNLSFELEKIKYTSEYLTKERIIKESDYQRNVLLIVIAFLLIGLAFAIPALIKIFRTKNKIRKLNSQLEIKTLAVSNELKSTAVFLEKFLPDFNSYLPMFPDKFLIFMPKDYVSGDFFWKFSDQEYEMIALADCTGHGMPGAMLTMLGRSTLRDIAISKERSAKNILGKLRKRIKELMSLNALNKMQDGMDISLIVINKNTLMMDFAGAYNSLLMVRNKTLNKIQATRCPIGEYVLELEFESHFIQLEKGDCIYMLTDGYTSQFGGKENSKIKPSQLNNLILTHHQKPMEEFKEILIDYFQKWKNDNEQVDDVTFFGFRVE